MLKRTLFFQSPGFLKLANKQLCFNVKSCNGDCKKTVPLEDIGMIILENPQITITAALMQALANENIIAVFCDEKHMPASFFSAFSINSTAQKVVQAQLETTEAVKNRLWKQTVSAKIRNQAQVLFNNNRPHAERLLRFADNVKNGDPENMEGVAARFYFSAVSGTEKFSRDPEGSAPNPALNYGYAILRAAMARALTGSGLLCIAGIHHHNQYNPFCLADDIMEPYRPFVDEEVFSSEFYLNEPELNQEMKRKLLQLLAADVMIKGMKRPLMNAMSYTSASLVRCLCKEQSVIDYPEFPPCQTNTRH